VTTTLGRAALDAWLSKADSVLAEARDASLSPSTVPDPRWYRPSEQRTTLAELAKLAKLATSKICSAAWLSDRAAGSLRPQTTGGATSWS